MTVALPGAGMIGDALLDEMQTDGVPAAVAWRLDVPPGVHEVTVEYWMSPITANLIARAIWFWPTADPAAIDGEVNMVYGGDIKSHLQADVLGGPLTAHLNPYCQIRWFIREVVVPCTFGLERTFQVHGPAEWTVLVVSAADGTASGSLALRGPAGASVLARAVEPAFLDVDQDFQGELNVNLELSSTSLKVMKNVQTQHSVEERFYGVFWGITTTGKLRMGTTAPAAPRTAPITT